MIVTIKNMETMHPKFVILCKVTFKCKIDLKLLISVLQWN